LTHTFRALWLGFALGVSEKAHPLPMLIISIRYSADINMCDLRFMIPLFADMLLGIGHRSIEQVTHTEHKHAVVYFGTYVGH